MTNWVRAGILLLTGWTGLVYGNAGLWSMSVLGIALGLLWLAGREMHMDGSAPTGLIAFTILAAAGVFWNLQAWAMFLIVLGALIIWDLQRFAERLARTTNIQGYNALLRGHVRRLAVVAALSLVGAGFGLGVQLRLNLISALGLGSLAAIALARMLRTR